jgi:hypothetical protein
VPVREGGDQGTPVVIRNPTTEAAKAFRALAAQVALKIAQLAVDAPREEPAQERPKNPLLRVVG